VSSAPSKILLATGNAHKAGEMRAILAPLLPAEIELIALKDIGLAPPPDEIERYKTFAANARSKAAWCSQKSGLACIADDSGIWVDALHGAPGVRSARWAGDDASDSDRCSLLLHELERVDALSPDQRWAKFVCACVFVGPDSSNTICATGSIRGQILLNAQGTGGFGYDPLFYIPKIHTTMASAGPEIKNMISHRARALSSLARQFRRHMQ
jgi:XTP/dITP diphosphohydrolase